MVELLSAFGSTPESVEALKRVTEGLPPDPTLNFRKARNGRYCLDLDSREIHRTEFQPFVLSVEEDFVRHDSGKLRHFAEINNQTQYNPTFRALLIFKALLVEGTEILHRPGLDLRHEQVRSPRSFTTRTTTSKEMKGEPALEGVHGDGVDHTMTVFLGAKNMTEESAVTRIHDMREVNAKQWYEIDPNLMIDRMQHTNFLDTILIVDHERKHSVSTIEARDPEQSARRDMMVFFTRKVALPDHVSFEYDSVVPHTSWRWPLICRTCVSERAVSTLSFGVYEVNGARVVSTQFRRVTPPLIKSGCL